LSSNTDSNVAIELADQFRRDGAQVFAAAKLRDPQHMAEHPALSALVTGLRIGHEDATAKPSEGRALTQALVTMLNPDSSGVPNDLGAGLHDERS
jgi:hypothetical protein